LRDAEEDFMSTQNDPVARDPVFGDLTMNWKWMLGLGILMAVLGVIGLGLTYGLTIISVLWFGVLAVIGGIAQLVDAFKYSGWKSVAAHVLVGLLYVGAGVVLIALPVQAAWWLTLLLAAVFLVTGVLRIVMAVQMTGGAAFWLGLSGVLSIGLGVLIFVIVDFPTEAALASVEGARTWFQEWGWVIGLFVALELIVQGLALISVSLTARGRGGTGATGGPERSASA
jgi:uncharacterized membrane protein HdeD (DUF308 family)